MIFGDIKYIAAAIIAAVVLGIYVYVQKLQKDLATSEANNIELAVAVKQQALTIEQIQRDVSETSNIRKELSIVVDRQRREVRDLEKKFFDRKDANGNPVRLADLAVSKPGLIEQRINRATNNAYRCMEIASGAPLTEQEQNAIKPSEINTECPSLANPNYQP